MSFLDNIFHNISTGVAGAAHGVVDFLDGDAERKRQQQAQQRQAQANQPSAPAVSGGKSWDDTAQLTPQAAPDASLHLYQGPVLQKANQPSQPPTPDFNQPDPNSLVKAPQAPARVSIEAPKINMPGEIAKQAFGGMGNDVVKFGDSLLGGVSHLADVVSYPIQERAYRNERDQGHINEANYSNLTTQAAEKAGFHPEDTDSTVLRKVTGAVAGPTAAILTAGAAPMLKTAVAPTVAALRAIGAGSLIGGAFGGIDTLKEDKPTLLSAATNIGSGLVAGGALGGLAPTAGRMFSKLRGVGEAVGREVGTTVENTVKPTNEVVPGINSVNPNREADIAKAAQDAAAKQAADEAAKVAAQDAAAKARNTPSEPYASSNPLDTPTYMRNQPRLPAGADRNTMGVPIDPNTPEGNVILNQGGNSLRPTTSTEIPAVPDQTVGLMDSTNSRLLADKSDIIPGREAGSSADPGQNVTDLFAPRASNDPAMLAKASELARAKALGAENIAPYDVPAPSTSVETLVRQAQNPTGSDAQLLDTLNQIITHPNADQGLREAAIAERQRIFGQPGETPTSATAPEPTPVEAPPAPVVTPAVEQVATKVENPIGATTPEITWYHGLDNVNTNSGDRFFSASKDVAGDYGKVSKVASEDMPKNPLTVTNKEDLAPIIGYQGDPMAELKMPKGKSFDEIAKQYAQSKGHDGIVYTDGSLGEPELHSFAETPPTAPTQADPRQQLIDGLANAREQSLTDAKALEAARSARAGKAAGMADGLEGQAATDARLAGFKGEMGHRGEYAGVGGDNAGGVFDELRLQVQRDPALAGHDYTIINLEDALSRAIKGVSLDGTKTGAPTSGQISLLRQYFGDDVGNAVESAVKESGPAWYSKDGLLAGAGEIAAAPKSIMASFDLSATLRQGGVLSSRFPKEASKAAVEQVKYFASKDTYEAAMKAISDDPYFETAAKSGLDMTGVKSLEKAEEQFIGKVIGKVPGIAGSERAYAGFLTKLRFDVFKNIVDNYAEKGRTLSTKELEDVSKFINTASGRGDLGAFLENHSKTLSTALFSPRLWKSRLDMLNPGYYATLSGPARKYALQSAVTFAGTASTVLGLAALAGAQVETDLRSSDFGKIKVGNTRYDILGGFQQNLVFAWRELTGEKKSSTTGVVDKFATGITDIGNQNGLLAKSKFGGTDRLKTLTDLVNNKSNPIISAAGHFLSGKDIGGKPINPIAELANLVVPLSVSGAVGAAQDQGDLSWSDPIGSAKTLAKGALINSPDFIGISSNTYGDVPTKYQPASLAKTPIPVPDAIQKVLDTKAAAVRSADFKPRGIPDPASSSFAEQVKARSEEGNYDAAIEGLNAKIKDNQGKKDIAKSTTEALVDQVKNFTVIRDGHFDMATLDLYKTGGDKTVSLSQWRNMGDPESDTYDKATYDRLWQLDSALAAVGGSRNTSDNSKNFYSAKAPGKGSSASSLAKSNTLGSLPANNRISYGNLAPQKIAGMTLPTLQQLKSSDLIKARVISHNKA